MHLLWTRLLVASVPASSHCLVHAILGMSSINILPCLTFACQVSTFSLLDIRLLFYMRYVCPSFDYVEYLVHPLPVPWHCFHRVSSTVLHAGLLGDVLVFKVRICVRPFPAGRFSINRFSLALFLHCQQGVSPSIFGHQYLITMDNNVLVCGNVFLEVSLRLASNEIRYPVSHTLLRIKSCIPTRCYQRNAA